MDSYQTKILQPSQISRQTLKQKTRGGKIVFTNGCFDIIHKGHLEYLQEARSLGDRLIVGLNSDESVRILKGKERPVNTLDIRLAVMASLFFVDWVTWFEEDTPFQLISKVVPDILVKGGDWPKDQIVGRNLVEQNGGEVLCISFVEGYSTTSVIEKIKRNNAEV